MKKALALFLSSMLSATLFYNNSFAQAPGCPNIIAQPDVTLPCSTPCTNLTATPFHVGNTSTYVVASTPYAPVIPYNQAGGTAVSVGTDDVYSPLINLPFPFCYYGNTYTSCVVGSNGNITFNAASANGYCPWAFTANCPSATLPLNSIFGVYHDIDPSVCGNVRWHLIGTAPCRMFVVNFNQVCHFSCTSLRTSSQIVLYETTNVIEVYTNAKPTCAGWNGGRAIIGIQNATGTVGLSAPARNSTPTWTVTAGEGWRFTPNGAPIYNVTWWQGATQIGTGNTINVCPTASPTTYTAQVQYTRCDGLVITDTDPVVVTLSNLPPPTVTPTAESCNNYNNGSVVINNAVGSGPYTVTINGPVNPPAVIEPNTAAGVASFSNLPDGSYTYNVVSANGCTVTGTFTINPGPPCCSVTAAGNNVTCNAATTGSASATPTGQAGFTYSWNTVPVQTTQTATNLGAGTYTVTMTDASGCVATANITLTQPTAITASSTPTHVTCNGLCNGSISVTASGGTGALQYNINGGAFQASNNFTGLCAGTYTIIIRDANGCTRTITQTITQPTAVAGSITANVPATCGANNGSVTVAGSGGTAPYTYNINGGAFQASGTFGSLAPGSYTIVVRDANGCTFTLTVTVANQSGPAATLGTVTNVSCAGGVNGSVVINASGGSGALSFDLNPGPVQASNTFNNLSAGAYNVVVTDANGCSSTVNFNITQPTQLTFTTVPVMVTCNGQCNGQITVTANNATPPYQYSSNGGLSFQASNVLTGLCAGSFNVVVRDANGCLANANVTITQPTALTGTLNSTNPICQGICNGTITVAGAGGGTGALQYNINGGAFQASNSFTGLCSGTHTVIIRDANGCTRTLTATLVDPPGYSITTISTTPSNCGFNDGALTVQAVGGAGGYTYNNVTAAIGPQASGTFSNLVAGAYQIIATDALGCQASTFVGVNDIQMSGTLNSVTPATCFGVCDGTVSTIATGGSGTITYDLDNGVQTQFGSGNFSNICAGPHAITMTDQGFCVFVVPFTITAPAAIAFTTSLTNVTCNGGTNGAITFNAPSGGTAPYQYSINNGTTFQASANFTGLTAGTYNLVVRDANGCTQTATVTITQPTAITFTTSQTNLTCFGNNSGTLIIVASGGTSPYTYSNNNGASFGGSFSFFSLAAGTYNLVVRDNAGCTATGTVTITQPAALSASYVSTATLCNGSCDGSIQVTASGGTTPYQYSSNNGVIYQPSSLLSNLCAGTYQLMVKDSNNCVVGSTQSVTQPTAITFTATPTPSTCGNPNGTITVVANGGTPTYQYSNNGGSTYQPSGSFTALAANTYTINVMDNNGCVVSNTATVSNQSSPTITNVTPTNILCNGSCTGQLVVTASGGTGALTFNIGGPAQASGTFSNLCANAYTITVTDANGCTATQNATLTQPSALSFVSNPTHLTCFGNNSGQIQIVASGGVTPYLYSYDNGATFVSLATQGNLAAGAYNLIVQDANGCQVTGTQTLNQPTQMQFTTQTSTNASCFGTCDGTINVAVSGGTVAGSYIYNWGSGVGGPLQTSITGLCAGSYPLSVTDDNNCAISTNFNITQPPAVVISSFSTVDVSCNGSCDGQINIIGQNTVAYSVDNGTTFQPSSNFTGLCSGVYPIVAQDANGCPTTHSATITEPGPLVLNPISDITICYNGFGTLPASATGGTGPYYYVWNTGDTTQLLNVNLTAPATFTCIAYDQNGCASNSQSANVSIIPAFVPVTTGDVSVCPGAPATIIASASLGVPSYTFTWFYGNDTLVDSDTLTFIPNGPTVVTLVAEDDCPTLDTLTINVSFYSLPQPNISAIPTSGCSPLVVDFTNATPVGQVGADCLWNFGNGQTASGCGNQTSTYVTPGCYDVTLQVTSPQGCIGDSTFANYICVYPNPVADFSFNPSQPTILDYVVNFTDQSTNGNTYVWDFAGLGTSTQQNPSFAFQNALPGQYQVCLTTTSPQGCIDDTCKIVDIFDVLLLYVPNAFSPDGDGVNDIFLPIVNGADPLHYNFMIFNRWGELIFETAHPQVGWDGNYKGQESKQDVYVWKIKARDQISGQEKEYYGHVSLLR